MLSTLSTLATLAALASSAAALPPPAPGALPIEAVRAVGAVSIPHRRRQVLSRRAEGDFDVLHRASTRLFVFTGHVLTEDVEQTLRATRRTSTPPASASPPRCPQDATSRTRRTSSGTATSTPTTCVPPLCLPLSTATHRWQKQYEYENQLAPFLYKLGNFTNRAAFSDSPRLAFLANWTSPITDPEEQLEKVTPYGKADARVLGALVAQRYPDLIGAQGAPFRIYSGAAERDVVRVFDYHANLVTC